MKQLFDKKRGKARVSALVMLSMLFQASAFAAQPTALTNYALGKTVWGPWNSAATSALVTDGKMTPSASVSTHSVGAGWNLTLDMGEDVEEYNKIRIHFSQYNTQAISVWTGNTLSAALPENPHGSTVTVVKKEETLKGRESYSPARVETTDEHGQYEMCVPFSFDAVSDRYITLENLFGASGGKSYSPAIAEVEVCRAEPYSVEIESEDRYVTAALGTFSVSARVCDEDGDEIADSALNGIEYSLSAGTEYAEIDPETGIVTVSGFDESTVDITVRAQSAANESVFAEKSITLVQSPISHIEIKDLPDFVDISKAGYGYVTYYPSAVVYGNNGEPVSDETAGVEWTLSEQAEGVDLDPATGAVTIATDTQAKEVTLICASTSIPEISERKTLYLYPKNLLSKAWTTVGFGGATTPYAIDSDHSTIWSAGTHSTHTIIAKVGGESKFNRIKIDFDKPYELQVVRAAAGNKLYSKSSAHEEVSEPPVSDGAVPWDNNFPLVTGAGSVGASGTSLYDVVLNETVNGDVLDKRYDEPVEAKYLQFYIAQDEKTYYSQSVRELGVYYVDEKGVYAKLAIPEGPVERTGEETSIELSSELYNNFGEPVLEAGGETNFTVESTNGDVKFEGNTLKVGADTENSLSHIRCTYTGDAFESVSDVYVKTDADTVSFGYDIASIEEVSVDGFSTYALEDGSEYVYLPTGTDRDSFERSVRSVGATEFAYSTDTLESGTVITISSAITGEKLKELRVIDESGYQGDLTFKPNIDSSAYTASIEMIAPEEKNVLMVLAEYGEEEGSELSQVIPHQEIFTGYKKISETITLKNTEAITKAMLWDGYDNMKPLCPVRVKNLNRQIVVVRLDDLKIWSYESRFKPEIEWLKERGIKCTLGLIASELADGVGGDQQGYIDFIKQCDADGYELFNHGYAHSATEFSGASYDEQYESFKKIKEIADEKCGITLRSFGPPNNAIDATAVQVISDWFSDDIKVIHPTFLSYDKGISVANNMFCKMEVSTGVVSYDNFVKSYEADYQDREYVWGLVHPGSWSGDTNQEEFHKIIEYLRDRNVIFMTPSEFYEYMKE